MNVKSMVKIRVRIRLVLGVRRSSGWRELCVSVSTAQIVTHADGSRVSIALIGLCDSVCLSVCPHDKIKPTETKIAKLGTG